MRLVVYGASGGCGRQVVAQAVARGHAVTAVSRVALDLPAGVGLRRGDVRDPEFVAAAMAGAEVVICGLGLRRANAFPWSPLRSPPDFASETARSIVSAMRRHGIGRVVAISAAGVAESAPTMNPVMRLLVATSQVGVAYRDLAVMEGVYAASGPVGSGAELDEREAEVERRRPA